MRTHSSEDCQSILNSALEQAKKNKQGKVASYIPELSQIPEELTTVAIRHLNGEKYTSGDNVEHKFTLQSVAKVVLLIGLLEELGSNKVFSWVKMEPSGDDFASIARLDQFGPLPYNPMLNSGAISLSSHIPGNLEQRFHWLDNWMEVLFGEKLKVNHKVFASERRTGDRNRSLAYLLKSNNIINGDVDEILETYFYLCSFEVNVEQAAYLPLLLTNKGKNLEGKQIISEKTSRCVQSIMATCGLYNESGTHLVRTGMPAKSGVSGLIIACALRHAGIAVYSPRVNLKGTSIRGELILEDLSEELGWHSFN